MTEKKNQKEKHHKGAGYKLDSYLPCDRKAFAETLQAMFTVSSVVDSKVEDSPTLLPKWKQKHVDVNMFDPNDVYFKGSAHMPLLGFLGNVPRRSDKRLLAREHARKEKRKAKQSSGDATGHQHPWSWSGSWQPSSWSYGNTSTWQPYDTSLHGQVAKNDQWHSWNWKTMD